MSAPPLSTLRAMQNASTLLQAGRFEQARSVLEAVLRTEPHLVEAWRLLAGAQLALGDRAEAERTLRRAAAIDPRWTPVQIALGELLAENGSLNEAAQLLRGAHANAPNNPRAALSFARMLLQTGNAQQAHDVIAAHATVANAGVEAITEYARALLALQSYPEAIEALRRVVQLAPADALAHARLAGALVSAERFAEAASPSQRALELGIDTPHAWFIAGSAAVGEGRYDDAEHAFGAACARDPGYADAQRQLAQLIWMRTADVQAATARLDATLRERPDAQDLLVIKASVHQCAGDDDAALHLLAEAAARDDADPGLLLNSAEAALKSGSALAVGLAERALRKLPGDPVAIGLLGSALLQAGDAEAARELAAQALQRQPDHQALIALFATALRLTADDRYRQIHDYAGLVHAWTIDTPDGWPDLRHYLTDLAVSLRRLHTLHAHPLHQSLRHGTQTTHNLMYSDDPAIRAFFDAIDGPIRRHMQAIGGGPDPTRRRNSGRYRIAGIWSVQLRTDGYHTNHVHPAGWLSSACYIDLPPAIERGHEGWLKFGEPGMPTKPPLSAEHYIRPQPGLLALFPSHMWHGTVPFHGAGKRLTIAFDVVPA